jgi:hypothetical protein
VVRFVSLLLCHPWERAPRYPLYRSMGEPHCQSGHYGEDTNLLLLPRIEHQLLDRPASSVGRLAMLTGLPTPPMCMFLKINSTRFVVGLKVHASGKEVLLSSIWNLLCGPFTSHLGLGLTGFNTKIR